MGIFDTDEEENEEKRQALMGQISQLEVDIRYAKEAGDTDRAAYLESMLNQARQEWAYLG